MLGKILSAPIKIINAPVKIAENVMDLATGGDGDRQNLADAGVPLPSKIGDVVGDTIEEIFDDIF